MEFTVKVLVGIVLAVITFLIVLTLMNGLNGNVNDQLGNFFSFLDSAQPVMKFGN
ncbi:MAG: hypothetical protein GXO64_00480 [Candidatus Micrarchaeota archaeon]|nr:hypothetical protein [Candidatus Micrarchaeota archaeon]